MKINNILKQWKSIFFRKNDIETKATNSTRTKYLSKVLNMLVLNEKMVENFCRLNNDDTELLVSKEEKENQFVEKFTNDLKVFESLTIKESNTEKIVYDCRSYEEKKNEIDDEELMKYLSKVKSKIRRNATCETILRQPKNKDLFNCMVTLLQEETFNNLLGQKNFLK